MSDDEPRDFNERRVTGVIATLFAILGALPLYASACG